MAGRSTSTRGSRRPRRSRASLRVIRYDRRGFGLSEGTPGRAADQEDLGRLLDQLRARMPRRSSAHSQGARVALAFALRQPERVAALVLDGPPDETGDAGAAGDEDFSIAEYRRLVAEQGVEAFRRAWRGHPLMRLHTEDSAARELAARMLERYPAHDLPGRVAMCRRRPPAQPRSRAS